MTRTSGALVTCAALSLVPAVAAADGSIRCPGGIVSTGDSKLDLVGKCGWPALREERAGERTVVVRERRGALLFQRAVASTSERWTYDFGPNQFIQHVVLDLGKVVSVERGGYGYERSPAPEAPPAPRARCGTSFHPGESSYEVLARCGEPAFLDARLDVRTRLLDDGSVVQAESATIAVEVWTYDFGPSTFVRRLTFEDGKLVREETGSYGYAR
jgi:hypothetical protein